MRISPRVKSAIAAARRWYGPAAESLVGHVNGVELARACYAAAAAGGGLAAFLASFNHALAKILPDPADRPLAVAALSLVAGALTFRRELRRRLNHGGDLGFAPPED